MSKTLTKWIATSAIGTGLTGGGGSAVSLDINGLTSESSPAGGDELAIYDITATAHRKTTLTNVFSGAAKQEVLTSQVITGTDTALTDTLNSTPVSNASVRLYMNGAFQEQGSGKDYTISGTTITWLASSGTAVDMDTDDDLVVVYDAL